MTLYCYAVGPCTAIVEYDSITNGISGSLPGICVNVNTSSTHLVLKVSNEVLSHVCAETC